MGSIWVRRSALLCLLALQGCSQGQDAPQTDLNFNTTANVHDFMVWYLEPAADVLWDSAGFILTEAGEEDLQPTTQEGWDHVRNAATVVAEGGNLLMLPGYAVQEADWMEYAGGMIEVALKAREAAVAQDADALFDAGGQVYNTCRACHNRYANFSPNSVN